MRRVRGFTLVELLVALFALAIMAALSWRGLDGMVRARHMTEARADEVLTLQTGLAQWAADLEAIEQYPPSPALQWNGRVLRLTRRSSLSPVEGVHVVGWTRREGQWVRWQSPAVTTRGDLDTAWVQADLWSQNPSDAMRGQEVAITPLEDWQVFFYRCNAWTNPLSSDASQCASAAPAGGPQPAAAGATPAAVLASAAAAAAATAGVLPDGVRLVLQLPPGRALTGRMQRDWVRPTVSGTKP